MVDAVCSPSLIAGLCALACTACVAELDDLTTKQEDVTASASTATATATITASECESDCTSSSPDAGYEADSTESMTDPSTSTDSTSDTPNVACGPGTYVVLDEAQIECRACDNGAFSTETGATACTPWKDCQLGEFVSRDGSTTRDRSCEACPEGETSEELNATACLPITCLVGSAKNDAGECATCEAGSYCPGGSEAAVTCGENAWDDDSDPTTACVDKHTCGDGEHVVDAGSPTVNRTCIECEPDTYNTDDNAATCTAFTPCEAGTYLSAAGSSIQDNTCVECDPGTFSAVANAPACEAWDECLAPDHRVMDEPTTSSNRTCAECSPPYVTIADNAAACGLYAFSTANGEVVIEAEHYFTSIERGDVSWILYEDASLSEEASMQVGTDTGLSWTSNPTTTAPELQYRVNFAAQGSYYVHVRGDAGTSSNAASDSCYAGIDGVTQQYTFDSNAGVWGWRSASFNVATAGLHLVSLLGREDGFRADKIVINTAANAPTGLGPEESAFDEALETE